ncbi:unknown [Prevotella sp. CAG:873]|nr:unknown [Prevotella sp. CAG:873]
MQSVNDASAVPVRRIDDQSIHSGIHQCRGAFEAVSSDAYTGSHAQTSQGVFACIGFVFGLGNVLISHQPD